MIVSLYSIAPIIPPLPQSLSSLSFWGAGLTHISYIYNIYKICHLGTGRLPTSIAGCFSAKRFSFFLLFIYIFFFIRGILFWILELLLCIRTAESASTRALTVLSPRWLLSNSEGEEDACWTFSWVLVPRLVAVNQSQYFNTHLWRLYLQPLYFLLFAFLSPKSSTPTTSPTWRI